MIRDQRDSAMVMKMIEFVHNHGPRWIIAIVRELSILSLKGSRILRFLFGLICIPWILLLNLFKPTNPLDSLV